MEDPNSQSLCWEPGLEGEAQMGQKQSQTHTQCPHEGPSDRQKGPKVDAVAPGVDAVGA